jgi:HEAT repeat protein
LRPFSSEDLTALLAHDSAFVRRGVAFDLLERFNPNDDELAAALVRGLADQDATVRHIALTAVRRLPHDKLVAALEPLTSLFTSPEESSANRIAAIRLIASMQSQAQDALPLLNELLRTDADSAVRSASAVAIARVADPPQAVQWLQRALADEPDPTVRAVLVVRLGRIGTPAAAALDELSQTLRTEDAELQRAVIDAMIAIGKSSVPHLILLLDSSDVAIRRLAVFALGSLGPAATDATESLQAHLQDQDAEIRQLAEIALARIASSR